MVLRYLEIPFRYGRLRRLLRTEDHGTIFSHLRFLDVLGVSVTVEEGTVEYLKSCLHQGLPVIAAVETGELRSYWGDAVGHAVVVVGFDDTHIYLNDPAFDTAPQVVTWQEFMLAWLEQDCRCGVISLQQIDMEEEPA